MNTSSTFIAADGDGYELTMGRWSRRLAPSFLEFVGTRDGERVLDLGCGTGSLAATLISTSKPELVHCIDLAPVYVAYAREKNPDARLVFGVGDACALEFPDASFDRVFSLLLLHFVPRATDAIAEMRRVAKPGAVVGAAVWDARGGYVAGRMFFDTAAALDPNASQRRAKNYTRPMTRPGELEAAFRTAGFEKVQQTLLGIRMEFASFMDYYAPYLGKEGPGAEYIATLDADRKARLEAAVREAYLDGEPDGPRSYAALAWAVKGTAPG